MRLTVTQLRPWIVTGIVVLAILIVGGTYLTRLALHGQVAEAPPAASPSPSSADVASSPDAEGTVIHGSSPAATASPGVSRSTTRPTRTSTVTPSRPPPSPSPSRTTAPRVLVAGPTIDNYYPDDSGCHVFFISSPDPGVTVEKRTFVAGGTPPPDDTGADAKPMRAEYVGCQVDQPGPGFPPADEGCQPGSTISTARGCGVRLALTGPTRRGTYRGTLSFDLSLLCAGAKVPECAGITSPHPPSSEHPVRAHWPVTCTIELTTEDGFRGDSVVECGLGGQ